MGKNDGAIWGPAVGADEDEQPTPMAERSSDERAEIGAEIEEDVLREEEPDPNQHGPAITGEEE